MKTFHVPINHPYIQNLTEFDLEFIQWSSALDDPKFFAKVKNTFYDDEFDEWIEEQENEELTQEEQELMQNIISGNKKPNEEFESEGFVSLDQEFVDCDNSEEYNDPDQWEEVE